MIKVFDYEFPRIQIVRGIPAAGKSTLIEAWKQQVRSHIYGKPYHPGHPKGHNEDFMVVCAMSDWFCRNGGGSFAYSRTNEGAAYAYAFRKAVAAVIGRTELVVIDQTNLRVVDMAPYVMLANAYGYSWGVTTVCAHPKAAHYKALQRHNRDVAEGRTLQGTESLPLRYFNNLYQLQFEQECDFPVPYQGRHEKVYVTKACIECGSTVLDMEMLPVSDTPYYCADCELVEGTL